MVAFWKTSPKTYLGPRQTSMMEFGQKFLTAKSSQDKEKVNSEDI